MEYDEWGQVREMLKRKNGLKAETDQMWEGSNKGEGSQRFYHFLAHNVSTYGIVDFEVVINCPSRKSAEIVALRSESGVEDTGLGAISIWVINDARKRQRTPRKRVEN